MTVDPSYRDFVLEQLGSVCPALNSRPMFGGLGIYSRGLFFALIAGDTLYFKVDDANRADYAGQDLRSFGKNYREVPIEVLENNDELQVWAEKACTAAANKATKKTPR